MLPATIVVSYRHVSCVEDGLTDIETKLIEVGAFWYRESWRLIARLRRNCKALQMTIG